MEFEGLNAGDFDVRRFFLTGPQHSRAKEFLAIAYHAEDSRSLISRSVAQADGGGEGFPFSTKRKSKLGVRVSVKSLGKHFAIDLEKQALPSVRHEPVA